jgi:hypothetical protein
MIPNDLLRCNLWIDPPAPEKIFSVRCSLEKTLLRHPSLIKTAAAGANILLFISKTIAALQTAHGHCNSACRVIQRACLQVGTAPELKPQEVAAPRLSTFTLVASTGLLAPIKQR